MTETMVPMTKFAPLGEGRSGNHDSPRLIQDDP